MGGLVTALRLIKTKKGDRMASFVLEDLEGSVEVLVFPEAYKKAGARLADDWSCSSRRAPRSRTTARRGCSPRT